MPDAAKSFDLPQFEIPDLPPKPLSARDYRAWLAENRRRLLEAGRLEHILADPQRCPVDARFTLPNEKP